MNKTETNLNKTQSLFKRYVKALDKTLQDIPYEALAIILIICIISLFLCSIVLFITNKRKNKPKTVLEIVYKYFISFICTFLMPFLAEFKGLAFIQFLIFITKTNLELFFEILVDMMCTVNYTAL